MTVSSPSRRGWGALAPSPRRGSTRRRRIGLAFTLPSVAFVGLVMAYPLIYLVYLAFHTYRPLSSSEIRPAGLDNFAALLTDETMRNSLGVTLQFTVASVLLEIAFGTLAAVLLAHFMLGVRGRVGRVYSRLLGSAFIIPFAVPAIAGAFAWRMLLDAQFGPVNAALGTRIPWLVEFPLASIVVIDAWKMTPFVLFVMLAAVMSVEPSQYEAAALDGAGAWRQFTRITLPSILPIMAITAAFRAVDAFTKVFDTVVATTGGGPGSETRVLPLLIWRTAFTNLDFGTASAQAIVALLVSLVFGGALLVAQRRNAS